MKQRGNNGLKYSFAENKRSLIDFAINFLANPLTISESLFKARFS